MGERRAPRPAGDTGPESFPVSGLGVILGDPWLSGTGRDSRRSYSSSSRVRPLAAAGASCSCGYPLGFGSDLCCFRPGR